MKRCISCNLAAEFVVKGSNEHYCKECAEMEIGEFSMLVSLEKPLIRNR